MSKLMIAVFEHRINRYIVGCKSEYIDGVETSIVELIDT